MQKRKLQCPICKSTHELYIQKHTYECPSCKRKVRAMNPVVAKRNEAIAVKEKKEIVKKVAEKVAEKIEETIKEEKKTVKKPRRKSTKAKSE